MKFLAILGVAAGAFCLAAGDAGADTITFDNTVASGGAIIPSLPYTEGAFQLTNGITGSSNGLFDQDWAGFGRTSDYFGWIGGRYFIVSRTDSAAFGLASLDLTALNGGGLGFTLTGHLSAGGTVAFSSTAGSTFTTFNFGSAWGSLSSLDIKSNDVNGAVDNIALTVVPLPPSALTGLTLLGGLGLAKVLRNRRKTALA